MTQSRYPRADRRKPAFDAAEERERVARATEPRAKRAYYDAVTKLIVVELLNGTYFAFPAQFGPGLENATPAELAQIEIDPMGEGLHWDRLDADISVPGMFEHMFGTKAYMKMLGRAGGLVKSAAKARAARRNGKKGGRPPSTGRAQRRSHTDKRTRRQ